MRDLASNGIGGYENICVRRGNTVYCWNLETSALEKITQETCTISECPSDVASDLMILMNSLCKEPKAGK